MENLDWIILAIIVVPIMITLGLGWNYIFVMSEQDYILKEKLLLVVVVVLLTAGIFTPLYNEKQESGFVNIISLSGFLLSLSIVGNFGKKNAIRFSKGCYIAAILLTILAFPYLIFVKVNPSLKDFWFFNLLERMDATSFSFAIVAVLIAGEVHLKKAINENKKTNTDS